MDPADRFSNTVDNYHRYRPGYPPALLSFMQTELELRPEDPIADIGSGTGKLSQLLLDNGNPVYAVEPNASMRKAAEQWLRDYPHFHSIDGRAEATGLPPASVDFITAGTAFHWFEVAPARREFQRILRPGGRVLLIWNLWHHEPEPFNRAYLAFLHRYATDFQASVRLWEDEGRIRQLFSEDAYGCVSFRHHQSFDLAGAWGRYRSSSYALPPDHPQFDEAREALQSLFDQVQKDGKAEMWFRTVVYFGRL